MAKYRCAMCGGVFEETWSDEEVMAELKQSFGENITKAECDVVCDDCYEIVKPSANPEYFAEWKTSNPSLQTTPWKCIA